VTVAPGDTLSGFAALLGVDWQALAAYNQLDHPDLLAIGQVLTVPPVGYVTPPAAVVPTSVRTSEPVVTAGQTLVRPPASRSIATYRTAPAAPASGFEACVIARESGGNAQVMNGSGHYGLFQYSYSTWVANGGSPSSFGHASVAEQQAVFDRTPHSAWTAYDGCR
jgi:murein DD-endopeptidase MepM/ murein hydrolase activator NlpD